MESEFNHDLSRTTVSLGGDCDTLTCIAGSMAEALFPIPELLKKNYLDIITEDMRQVLAAFDQLRT
ncbi:MAG: hypothetical protein J6C11_04570 [Spirochaetaceae bacterium]|nr:hypothetical protein [Spirochaetaceae bacterium]